MLDHIRKQRASILDTYKPPVVEIKKGEVVEVLGYGYGPGNEAIKFSKTGKEIKAKLPGIKQSLQWTIASIENQKAYLEGSIGSYPTESRQIKGQYCAIYSDSMCYPKQEEKSECESQVETIASPSPTISKETTQDKCRKYNDLNYDLVGARNDLKILETIEKNLDEKKTYELSVGQLVALQFDQDIIKKSETELAFDELEKGGEGSKGGKVIGHTKSGKPIYENASGKSFRQKELERANGLMSKFKQPHRLTQDAFNHNVHIHVGVEHKDELKYHLTANGFKEKESKGEGKWFENSNGTQVIPKFHKDKDKVIKKSLTPFEQNEALIKSRIASTIGGQAVSDEDLEKSASDFFEKGRKAVPGEKRTFGGKDYIKTANGWRLVGKNKGKHKDISDAIHGPITGSNNAKVTEAFKNNYNAASKEQREHVAEKYFGDKNKDLMSVGSHHHEQLSDSLYDKIQEDSDKEDSEFEKITSSYDKKTPQERTQAARKLAESTTDYNRAVKLQGAFEDQNYHGIAEIFQQRANELKKK